MGQYVDQMDGVILSPLKIISNEKGNIMHALKKSEKEFSAFGEAYFSFVNHKETKGWKKHQRMTLNLVVPMGEVQFFVFDDREESATKNCFFTCTLSQENYMRLTLSPGLWFAFKGIGESENLLMNIANIEHDPTESINQDLNAFELP